MVPKAGLRLLRLVGEAEALEPRSAVLHPGSPFGLESLGLHPEPDAFADTQEPAVFRIPRWASVTGMTFMQPRLCSPPEISGIVLMLPHCDTVDVYEYVPSVRLTDRCHYFDELEDSSCTFGVWHPLAAEKMLSLGMNEANDSTVFLSGFIRIGGYRNLKC